MNNEAEILYCEGKFHDRENDENKTGKKVPVHDIQSL